MHHHFFRERKSVVINFLTIPYYICYDLVTFNPLRVAEKEEFSTCNKTTLENTPPAVAKTKIENDNRNERHDC